MKRYDLRGGAEVEQFHNDKSGLGLAARRKHSFLGQKGFIILTDLAHSLLADFYHRALASTKFDGYGLKRIVHDLLAMPGRLVFENDKPVRVELLSLKQNAKDLSMCLERYISLTFRSFLSEFPKLPAQRDRKLSQILFVHNSGTSRLLMAAKNRGYAC